ncbi:hypothetical protein NMG60_11005252 [Bertholletia excelsa]
MSCESNGAENRAMAEEKQKTSPSSSSSIDPKSGFCSVTKTYHSLRPQISLPPETTNLSITDFIFYLLQQNPPPSPDSAALIDAITGCRISLSQLLFRTKTLAASLRDILELSRGNSAFIICPNSIHLPILYLALSLVVVSPSNPASSVPEISRQIEISRPIVAFATCETAHKVPPLRRRTILLDSAEFEYMMTRPSQELPLSVEVSQSNTAAILFSSGTTGGFKGAELTHRNFIWSLAAHASRPVRSAPAVSFCTVPYFHIYGFNLWMRSVAIGNCVVTSSRFDPRAMIRAVEELKVTHVALGPPAVIALSKDVDWLDGCDLSSLQTVSRSGAPLGRVVIDKFKKKFPTVQLSQGYGLTETTGAISRAIGPDECQRSEASGRLLSCCQGKIVDIQTGTSLPPLNEGELWIKGPNTMKGYAGDKEATAMILDSEGWIRTGDVCYIDDEGFLYVCDRLKELIKYKGYQVAPLELENLLRSHPDILDAAVIPYPDEEAGEVPMAFVVRRPQSTIDESQVQNSVAEQVAPYKKIRRVWFINSIPRNAAGKVLRKDLTKLALSGASSKL